MQFLRWQSGRLRPYLPTWADLQWEAEMQTTMRS